jgi:hypothetical protein
MPKPRCTRGICDDKHTEPRKLKKPKEQKRDRKLDVTTVRISDSSLCATNVTVIADLAVLKPFDFNLLLREAIEAGNDTLR